MFKQLLMRVGFVLIPLGSGYTEYRIFYTCMYNYHEVRVNNIVI